MYDLATAYLPSGRLDVIFTMGKNQKFPPSPVIGSESNSSHPRGVLLARVLVSREVRTSIDSSG